MSAGWGRQPRTPLSRHGRTALILLALLWLVGAWATRGVDSDTGTSTSVGVRDGEDPAPTEQSWRGPGGAPEATGGAAAVVPAPPVVTPTPTPTRASRSHRTLPAVLLRIRWCESHNDYKAENPTSTASGAWQILDGTWDGYAGYLRAKFAPPRIQDSKALALYKRRGTQPWDASRRCWS